MHDTIRDEFLCGAVIWSVFYLAENEMALVKERPDSLLKQHANKLTFFYSQIDNWVPKSYYSQMITDYPEIRIQVVEDSIPHGFVEQHSIQMAEKVVAMLT